MKEEFREMRLERRVDDVVHIMYTATGKYNIVVIVVTVVIGCRSQQNAGQAQRGPFWTSPARSTV